MEHGREFGLAGTTAFGEIIPPTREDSPPMLRAPLTAFSLVLLIFSQTAARAEQPPECARSNIKYDNSRGFWYRTSTDGERAELQPRTLTYSFIPDGTSIPSGIISEPESPSELFARMDSAIESREQWKDLVRRAFNSWEGVTG